jgi:hypothetical protein
MLRFGLPPLHMVVVPEIVAFGPGTEAAETLFKGELVRTSRFVGPPDALYTYVCPGPDLFQVNEYDPGKLVTAKRTTATSTQDDDTFVYGVLICTMFKDTRPALGVVMVNP